MPALAPMFRCALPVWSSSNGPSCGDARRAGFTLIELLVTLTILSILAAAALPFAEMIVTRNKELELRRALREVRSAIDAFHEDWASGKISKTGSSASDDGYPRSLQTLIDGVDGGDAKGGKRRYLRRVPRDPFGEAGKAAADQWLIRGYQDDADALIWSGKDVYDIRSRSERNAGDGTRYRDW
jgi:general secretion pathway protein G